MQKFGLSSASKTLSQYGQFPGRRRKLGFGVGSSILGLFNHAKRLTSPISVSANPSIFRQTVISFRYSPKFCRVTTAFIGSKLYCAVTRLYLDNAAGSLIPHNKAMSLSSDTPISLISHFDASTSPANRSASYSSWLYRTGSILPFVMLGTPSDSKCPK